MMLSESLADVAGAAAIAVATLAVLWLPAFLSA